MRRDERQHLKENELAHSLASLQEFVGPRSKALGAIVIGVIVVAVIAIGAVVFRQRSQSQGQALLADALVALDARVVPASAAGQAGDAPAAAQFGATGTFSTEAAKLNAALPKLKAAADAYPDAPAGITARYHMAGALAALGRQDEAIAAFDDVTKRSGRAVCMGGWRGSGKPTRRRAPGSWMPRSPRGRRWSRRMLPTSRWMPS